MCLGACLQENCPCHGRILEPSTTDLLLALSAISDRISASATNYGGWQFQAFSDIR
jgi:hypothetical protein